jgi:hypothetical protein
LLLLSCSCCLLLHCLLGCLLLLAPLAALLPAECPLDLCLPKLVVIVVI